MYRELNAGQYRDTDTANMAKVQLLANDADKSKGH
jgi:hypothetical protein